VGGLGWSGEEGGEGWRVGLVRESTNDEGGKGRKDGGLWNVVSSYFVLLTGSLSHMHIRIHPIITTDIFGREGGGGSSAPGGQEL